MVAKEARLTVALVFDCGRGEDKVEVSDLVIGQYGPELVVDELGRLFSDEVGVE